jgi:hypothetical protein
VGDERDVPRVSTLRGADDQEVRLAATVATAVLGGRELREQVGRSVWEGSRSTDPSARALAARVLAAGPPGLDRLPLVSLLADPDPTVASAALDAFHWEQDGRLGALLVAPLAERRTAEAASAALSRGDTMALPVVDTALDDGGLTTAVGVHLARVARHIGGREAADVLRRHLGHPDREVGLAVMQALASTDPAGREAAEDQQDARAAMHADLAHATLVLDALVTVDGDPRTELLCAGLRDELDILRRRVMAALSIRYGTADVHRVELQLGVPDERSHGLAVEWLDVTLPGSDRACLALIDPSLTPTERLRALIRRFPRDPRPTAEVLRDLVEDEHDRWRQPWLRACAFHTAADLPIVGTAALAAGIERSRSKRPGDDLLVETSLGLASRGHLVAVVTASADVARRV